MPLTSSGTLSFATIRNEFKGLGSWSMNPDGYRGQPGSYVPPIAINQNVPTSGQIQVDDFYGAGTDIDLDSIYSVSSTGMAPTGETTGVTAYADGGFLGGGNTASFSDIWVANWFADPGPWYECYLEVVSGYAPNVGDTPNTWLDLGSNRQFDFSETAEGTYGSLWRLHIRNKFTQVIKDACDINVALQIDPFTK